MPLLAGPTRHQPLKGRPILASCWHCWSIWRRRVCRFNSAGFSNWRGQARSGLRLIMLLLVAAVPALITVSRNVLSAITCTAAFVRLEPDRLGIILYVADTRSASRFAAWNI